MNALWLHGECAPMQENAFEMRPSCKKAAATATVEAEEVASPVACAVAAATPLQNVRSPSPRAVSRYIYAVVASEKSESGGDRQRQRWPAALTPWRCRCRGCRFWSDAPRNEIESERMDRWLCSGRVLAITYVWSWVAILHVAWVWDFGPSCLHASKYATLGVHDGKVAAGSSLFPYSEPLTNNSVASEEEEKEES